MSGGAGFSSGVEAFLSEKTADRSETPDSRPSTAATASGTPGSIDAAGGWFFSESSEAIVPSDKFKEIYPDFLTRMSGALKEDGCDVSVFFKEARLLSASASHWSDTLTPDVTVGYSKYFHNPKPKLIGIVALLTDASVDKSRLIEAVKNGLDSWNEQNDGKAGHVNVANALQKDSGKSIMLEGFPEDGLLPVANRGAVADVLHNVVSNVYKYADNAVVRYVPAEQAIYVIDDAEVKCDEGRPVEDVLFKGAASERAEHSSGKGLGACKKALKRLGGDISYVEGDNGVAGMHKAIKIALNDLSYVLPIEFNKMKKRVLVLEDEGPNISMIKRFLGKGVSIVVARSIQSAEFVLALAADKGGFTHITLDNTVPDGTGREIYAEYKDTYFKNSQVAFISGGELSDFSDHVGPDKPAVFIPKMPFINRAGLKAFIKKDAPASSVTHVGAFLLAAKSEAPALESDAVAGAGAGSA